MSKKILQAAAGAAGGESVYVEDVFSTYLYEGTGATQTITNGIDLSGEGGLVWTKSRGGGNNYLFDTERGALEGLISNGTNTSATRANTLTAFTSSGFTLGPDTSFGVNVNNASMASWSFRKQAGFFDVVTYTGDGSGDRNISHSLSSTPACIILKKTSTTSDWSVYHIGAGTGAFDALALNQTSATGGLLNYILSTSSTDFEVRSSYNDSGVEYVAYLFAHDDQSFGDNSDESIIKCGSYTGNGSTTGPEINLGWEPQWLLIKNIDDVRDWIILDSMRGIVTGGNDERLYPNSSTSESGDTLLDLTSTGFQLTYTGDQVNGSGENYIYIAIRRPMKTPEAGTDVFNTLTSQPSADDLMSHPILLDMVINKNTSVSQGAYVGARLLGTNHLITASTSSETYTNVAWDYQTGYEASGFGVGAYVSWAFKRATGFFDVVAYTGTGSAHTEEHNLGVVPELAIVKTRSRTGDPWYVTLFNTSGVVQNQLRLNEVSASPTADGLVSSSITSFTVPTVSGTQPNVNNATYIAYLFATLAGVSKVGSYSGTGSDINVDCGFSAGARFILIKRTDSTGDWYVYDSERGIVAGNDPYILINSTASEVTTTDYIDPLSSGFTVTSSAPAALNASGGTYIFLAIA